MRAIKVLKRSIPSWSPLLATAHPTTINNTPTTSCNQRISTSYSRSKKWLAFMWYRQNVCVELTVSLCVGSLSARKSRLQDHRLTDWLTDGLWGENMIINYPLGNKLLGLEYSLNRTQRILWRTCWYQFTHHTISLRVNFNIILQPLHPPTHLYECRTTDRQNDWLTLR